MCHQSPSEDIDIRALEELSEELANANGSTAKEIEQRAENIDIEPPSAATIIDD